MKKVKISELTRVSSLTGAEIVPFAKDGSNGAVTTAKLKEYAQPDLSAITTALGGKVDKVTGKGLSTNDYTDTDKEKLTALPTNTQLTQDLASKLNASVWNDAHEQFSIEGSYWSYQNGKVVSDAVWKRTPRIPLNRDAPIILKNVSQSGNAATCFFDEGGNFISAVKGAHGALATIEPSAYPDNAVFVGISTRIEEDTTYSNGDTVEAREGAVSDAIQASTIALFVDQWNAACGSYGKYDPANAPDAQHPFYLNTLWLTYEEAIAIMQQHVTWGTSSIDCLWRRIKTNIPLLASSKRRYSNSLIDLEVANAVIMIPNWMEACFIGDTLKKILGLNMRYLTNPKGVSLGSFNAPNLEVLEISNLKISLDLSKCPLINLTSWQGLVANAANTSEITVTVHPNVYAKLTDTTNTDWYAVTEAAAAKQINFATT